MTSIAPALLLAFSCFASDELNTQILSVAPRVVKPGDVVVVDGVSLGEDKVEEVYLSDHKFDMKVKVLEQNATTIKFRVPPLAKPGRVVFLMLIKPKKEGDNPKLLELATYILIEDLAIKIGEVETPEKRKTQDKQR